MTKHRKKDSSGMAAVWAVLVVLLIITAAVWLSN